MKKVVSLLDVKEMKTRNDCEIACDCVKRANVVLHVGLCEEIFARKHTATHKPTSSQPLSALIVTSVTYIHTRINRLWSALAYGLGGNKQSSLCACSCQLQKQKMGKRSTVRVRRMFAGRTCTCRNRRAWFKLSEETAVSSSQLVMTFFT